MMLGKKHLLFSLLFLFACSTAILAQDDEDTSSKSEDTEATDSNEYPYPAATTEEYKDYVSKKRQDQHDKFLDGKYNYPARPRDKWEIGINAGLLMVSGDVKTGFLDWSAGGNFHPKLGFGGHIRRSFGYVFSLRANFMAGTTWGRNWQGAQGWAYSSVDDTFIPNKALSGGGNYDQFNDDFDTPEYQRGDVVYYNYKTNIRELSISGVFNLHNIRFHKRDTKIGIYGLAGIGGVAYRTFMDQLDADGNEYDYSVLMTDPTDGNFYEERGDALDALDNVVDGTFESQAERHFDDWTPFDNFSYKPTAHVGTGIAFKLGRVVNLALETRVTYTNDDLLDGQRWQEWGALTRDYDTFVYTGVNANFNIGRKNAVEPLWWMNPLDYSYEEMAEPPCCDELELPDLEDDDKDGVPNAWDKEPDSREGCPVDTHGRMLDSDRDGVLDCDDECPHTQPRDIFGNDQLGKVDEYGCAPAVDCSDIEGAFCDCVNSCKPIVRTPVDPCANPLLPSILFDLNKFSVKPEFEPQLAEVARYLRNCPSSTICVIGHTDVRASNSYNDVLSYKRAQEVIEKLVTNYGIPRSQLVLQYRGEMQPTVMGLSDAPTQKGIDADHALNRRVEFRKCPPSMDMPMPKGPKNAGTRQPRP